MDINSCRTQPGLCRNSLAIAETKPKDASVVIYRNQAADLELTSEDVSLVDFSLAGGLVVTGTALSGEPSASAVGTAISAARQAGCPVIIDIDYRANAWQTAREASRRMSPELARADIIVGNNDEFSLLCGGDVAKGIGIARNFAASGQMVLYKMGEQGCRTFYQGREMETGIFPVTLAKPFGAGDAFLGNVLAKLRRDANIRAAVIQEVQLPLLLWPGRAVHLLCQMRGSLASLWLQIRCVLLIVRPEDKTHAHTTLTTTITLLLISMMTMCR